MSSNQPIFDFVFNGMQAYNQIGMFIGALLCLGIGGLVLGNALYWRVHALRAAGEIIGVIANGNMYTTVYRYTLPTGETHEAKADTSSNATSGRETGRTVPLMVSAHNPAEVRRADSYVMEIIGAVIVAPGLFFGYTALTAYPFTPMTWVMAVLLIAHIAQHLCRIFIPKGQRISIAEWKAQHGLDSPAAIDLSTVKPMEEIVSTPQMDFQRKLQIQNNKKDVPILIIFALLLGGGGVYEGFRISHLQSAGLRAQGHVTSLKEEYSSSNHGGNYTYYPIVDYRTADNRTISFKDSTGSNPPGYHVGDTVTVLYLADDPQKQAIIDRGLLNWLVPAIFLAFAVVLAWVVAAIRRSTESAQK